MRFALKGTEIAVSPLYLFLLLCISVFDYTGIVRTALVASLLHEAGHLAVLLLQRQKIYGLYFSPAGIRLDRGGDYLPGLRDIPVFLAGPAVNLLCGLAALAALQQRFQVDVLIFCLVHLLLGGFNLLPVSVLDGGQVLYLLLWRAFGRRRPDVASALLSYAVLGLLCLAGAWLLLHTGGNPTLLIAGLYLLWAQRRQGSG